MAAEENFLSTPTGYATPNQIAALREYAKALMKPGEIRPLAHYMPAIADAVSGLTGGYMLHRAGEREKESADFTGAAQTRGLMGEQTPAGRPAGGPQAAPTGAPATPAPGASASPSALGYAPQGGTMAGPEIEAYIRQAAVARGIDPNIALQVYASEGKGGVGPSLQSTVVKNGVREPSFGPYQLYMGGGLGNEFLKSTGLDPRDPSTFKQQIDFALDSAAKGGWGPWYGWKGDKWAGINRGGAPAMAFAGEQPTGGVGNLPSNALALTAPRGVGAPAGGIRGGGTTGPVTTPIPNTGGIPNLMFPMPVPPGVANRTAPSPEVMRHLLGAGAGYANPAVTQTLANLFLQRNQPQQLDVPGGKLIIPPGSNQGYYVPTIMKVDPPQSGSGAKPSPSYQFYHPGLGGLTRINQAGQPELVQPGIPAPPSSPETAPPSNLLPGGAAPVTPPAPPPARPAAAPTQQATTPPAAATPAAPATTGSQAQAPTELEMPTFGTTATPTGGVVNFAPEGQGNFPPNLLNIFPPTETNMGRPVSGEQEQEPVSAYTSGQGGQQTAQAAPAPQPQTRPQTAGSPLSPQDEASLARLNEIDLQQKGLEGHQAEDVKLYKETTKNLYTAGQAARTLKGQIQLGLHHIQEGLGYQGRLAPAKQFASEIGAEFLPLFGEGGKKWAAELSDRAGATQVFDKAIAASILNDLKVMLQGLGQIRVAEIDLMNRAAPSITNQPSANKAILDLGMRSANIAQDLSTMAAWYDRGARVDSTGKLIVGSDGRPVLHGGRPTTEGLQRTLQVVYDNHPQKLSPEQLAIEQTKLFGSAKGPVQTHENRPQPQQTQQPRGGRGVPQQRTQAPAPPPGDWE